MPTKIVTIDEDLYDALKDESERTGDSLRVVASRRLRAVAVPPVGSLAEACAVIAAHLPEYQTQVEESLRDTKLPLEAYVLSHLDLITERVETSYLNPRFVDEVPEPVTPQAKTGDSTCDWCKAPFQAERRGQKYCRYECGKAASRKLMPARPRIAGPPLNEPGPDPATQFAPANKGADELAVYLKGFQGPQ